MSDPARRHRRHADPAGDGPVLPPVPPGARALLVGASGPLAGPVGVALAQAGWGVAVVGSDSVRGAGAEGEAAQALVATLPGPGHAVLSADPADPSAVSALVESLERVGGIDLLVDVSGAAATLPPIGWHPADWSDAFSAALTVDLLGPAAVAHAVAHSMARSGRPGSIVMVAGPESGTALSAAVSAGRKGLASGLAAELRGTPVAVSTVVVGGAGPDQVAGAVLSLIRGASASLTLR